MNPRFPVYIVSKGRADSRLTSKSLEHMRVPYFIVIEEAERKAYSEVIDAKKVLVLDPIYQKKYDTFDQLGEQKSKGPGPARNFAWEHSIANGYDWHWVMDDNIHGFYRLNKNSRNPLDDGTAFHCMEDFVLRYTNVGMAGPSYFSFSPSRTTIIPIILNTRIYSCNLIRNDVGFRWRGRYNEDTDLSLRILKARWCTIQFNAFLQNKIVTQALKGGNTDAFYAKEGTSPKSRMLVNMHPDVTRIVKKFGRIHHQVDYGPFKANKLIRKKGLRIKAGIDNYGMELVHIPRQKKSGAGKSRAAVAR